MCLNFNEPGTDFLMTIKLFSLLFFNLSAASFLFHLNFEFKEHGFRWNFGCRLSYSESQRFIVCCAFSLNLSSWSFYEDYKALKQMIASQCPFSLIVWCCLVEGLSLLMMSLNSAFVISDATIYLFYFLISFDELFRFRFNLYY